MTTAMRTRRWIRIGASAAALWYWHVYGEILARHWWGKSTRFKVTNSLDGIIYALITGATFGWLCPH
jgi:hypothetical protein